MAVSPSCSYILYAACIRFLFSLAIVPGRCPLPNRQPYRHGGRLSDVSYKKTRKSTKDPRESDIFYLGRCTGTAAGIICRARLILFLLSPLLPVPMSLPYRQTMRFPAVSFRLSPLLPIPMLLPCLQTTRFPAIFPVLPCGICGRYS